MPGSARGGRGGRDRVANLLVGDLWLLAGQSNMQGVGNLENRRCRAHW